MSRFLFNLKIGSIGFSVLTYNDNHSQNQNRFKVLIKKLFFIAIVMSKHFYVFPYGEYGRA